MRRDQPDRDHDAAGRTRAARVARIRRHRRRPRRAPQPAGRPPRRRHQPPDTILVTAGHVCRFRDASTRARTRPAHRGRRSAITTGCCCAKSSRWVARRRVGRRDDTSHRDSRCTPSAHIGRCEGEAIRSHPRAVQEHQVGLPSGTPTPQPTGRSAGSSPARGTRISRRGQASALLRRAPRRGPRRCVVRHF